MNRRGFLAMIAGAALDPERLLWVPGRKLISIPKPNLNWLELRFYPFVFESVPLREFQVRYNRLLSLEIETGVLSPETVWIES